MKKKVIYIVPRQEDIQLYDFAANRHLFKTFKSCGSDGCFYMNMTEVVEFDIDVSCSPISLGG
jgi:hypothetical protein